jgi:hypothetical protein
MRIKQDLPPYNASIYLRTESSEREKRRGPNEKKIRKFMIHAANSVCIAIDAGNFDAPLRHCLHRIPQCKINRLFVLLLQAEKEIRFLLKNCIFKLYINVDRHGPRPLP